MADQTCLCHFSNGDDGVYTLNHDRLLKGTTVALTGLDGIWTITEMEAPDEAEVIDAELWLRPATDEELVSTSGSAPQTRIA